MSFIKGKVLEQNQEREEAFSHAVMWGKQPRQKVHPVEMPEVCLAGWRKSQMTVSLELRERRLGRRPDHRGEGAPHYTGPGSPYKDFGFTPSDAGRLWKRSYRGVTDLASLCVLALIRCVITTFFLNFLSFLDPHSLYF